MNLIALDFWSIVVYAFFASVLWVGYRLTWRLAYFCEGLIINLARTGMHGTARTLLVAFVGYDAQTYQQSRFIIWNQVHVRFFILWGATFLLASLVLLFQIRPVIWMPVALIYNAYRIMVVWLNPPRPPIHTQDPALRQLIQDVNEPLRSTRTPARPVIRRWDYLDELFAESA